jgi:hypothetical protein
VRTSRGPWLLYDNLEDPFQLVNRVEDPQFSAVREDLESELRGWLDRLGDEFLEGAEYVRRAGLEHYFEVNEPLGFCEGPRGSWRSTNPRGRVWSIDTQFSRIEGDPDARELLREYAPAMAVESRVWNRRHSPRIAAMADPARVSSDDLAALDKALGQLPPRDLAGPQDVADAGLPPSRRLLPALV